MKKEIETAFFVAIAVMSLCSCSCDSQETVDKYIDKRQWDKAYKAAAKWYVDLPESYVLLPHITDLVLSGDYTIAKQICTERKYMQVYYKAIYSNLERIYENQGEQRLLYALTSVPHFDTSKYIYISGMNSLGELWYYSGPRSNTDMVRYNNQMLESFCDYLLLSGNAGLAKQVITGYLLVIKDKSYEGRYDTSAEYKRIRNKFGIK